VSLLYSSPRHQLNGSQLKVFLNIGLSNNVITPPNSFGTRTRWSEGLGTISNALNLNLEEMKLTTPARPPVLVVNLHAVD